MKKRKIPIAESIGIFSQRMYFEIALGKIYFIGIEYFKRNNSFLGISKKINLFLAGNGFDPSTSGLWAQHASTAPPCCCALIFQKQL